MHNLSICFGPANTVWALLFKDPAKAAAIHESYQLAVRGGESGSQMFAGTDDYGQQFAIPLSSIHGVLLENLELIEAARIQRALVDERCKAKFMQAAKSDPTIMAAARAQGAPILTPMGGMR